MNTESNQQEGRLTPKYFKNKVARDKGYPSWEVMENFIIDNNLPVNVAILLTGAMDDVFQLYAEQFRQPVSVEPEGMKSKDTLIKEILESANGSWVDMITEGFEAGEKYHSQFKTPSPKPEYDPYGYWPQCDVEGCEGVSGYNGMGWRETGYWCLCSKHSQEFREGKPQPKMKQSAIDKEKTRDPLTGTLPSSSDNTVTNTGE